MTPQAPAPRSLSTLSLSELQRRYRLNTSNAMQLQDDLRQCEHAEAIAVLQNSGIDVECGACMEVAFTGVTTNAHTCQRQREAQQAESSPDDHTDIYAPGEWRCPQCNFCLSKMTLFTKSGNVGVSAHDVYNGEPCPNDGTPMVKVRWRERAEDHYAAYVKLVDDVIAAAQAKSLPAALDRIRQQQREAQPPHCTCEKPLRGERPGVGPRCRLCNKSIQLSGEAQPPQEIIKCVRCGRVMKSEGDDYCEMEGYKNTCKSQNEVSVTTPPAGSSAVEAATTAFNTQIDQGLDHYAGKIAKRAFRNVLPDLLAVRQEPQQEIARLEANLKTLIKTEELYRANEGAALRRLSDALTDGAAGTWDEIFDAAESLERERDALRAQIEREKDSKH